MLLRGGIILIFAPNLKIDSTTQPTRNFAVEEEVQTAGPAAASIGQGASLKEAPPLMPDPNRPLYEAGGISRYLKSWLLICQDNFIINIVQNGYKIPLYSSDIVPHDPIISKIRNSQKIDFIKKEIQRHIASGAFKLVDRSPEQFVWRIFIVPKSSGGFRLIIDLSPLNLFIPKIHFKMEGINSIINLLQENDYMCSIDLMDAFFTIPLHKDSKKFVVFEFCNQRYQFQVLPFGLSASPRIFSKVLKPVIAYLRSLGIKISFYLDDIFLCASSSAKLKGHLEVTMNLLESLGFTINFTKSNLIPSQTILHLGYIWNSSSMTLALPHDKVLKSKRLIQVILESPPSIREVASLVGLLSSHSNAFPFAPLHFRAIQRCLSYNLRNSSSWDEICHLDEDALKDLLWWSHCPLDLPPLSFKEFVPSITLSTDASLSGWGGTLSSGSSASGHWSLEEKQLHINMLELKAIKFCVLSFLDLLRNQSMLLLSDNSSCVFYINKFGGTHSKEMCNLSIEIWDIMLKNNITCLAKHIPGVDNSSADSLSRLSPIPNDFGLSQTAFNLLTSLIPFELNVDMFASRLSNKLERFVSWHNDPFSWRVDAFSFRWSHNLYFSPLSP